MVSFNLGNPQEYRAFYAKLKAALGKGDKQTVAAMVNYPLRVNGDKEHKIPRIRTKADLVAHYDRIFTPELVAAIVKEDYEDVIARDIGVGLANGSLWFTGACVDKACKRRAIKVITVNMP
nr:hypothetical protein [Pseudomonas sp.]